MAFSDDLRNALWGRGRTVQRAGTTMRIALRHAVRFPRPAISWSRTVKVGCMHITIVGGVITLRNMLAQNRASRGAERKDDGEQRQGVATILMV